MSFSRRALARIGNAYFKQEKWELAIKYFDKSLAEHRNQDIVKKKKEVSATDVSEVPLRKEKSRSCF